jgi:plastocyanin
MLRRMQIAMMLAVLTLVMLAPHASAAVVVKGVSTSQGFRFRPARVSVAVGARVKWRAVTGTHTVTAYSNNWSKNTRFSPGDPTGFTFHHAGRYKYRCTFHSFLSNGVCSGMCGRVVVG